MIKENTLNEQLKRVKVDFEVPVKGSLGLVVFGRICLQLMRNRRGEVAIKNQMLQNFNVTNEG